MLITPIKTPIVHPGDDVFTLIKQSIATIPEKSVLAVTSKVVALSEGRVVPIEGTDKHELVRQEADQYTEPHSSKYHMMLTIHHHHLAVNAGIDASNADGNYVLWPADPQASVNRIWNFIRETYQVAEVGIIMTDSRSFPLEWGVVGMCISSCGFKTLNDKRGETDLFGRTIEMTQVHVAHALASAAVYEMGETNEAQPLCLIENIPQIDFLDREPTADELKQLSIELEDDIYAPLLAKAEWHSRE